MRTPAEVLLEDRAAKLAKREQRRMQDQGGLGGRSGIVAPTRRSRSGVSDRAITMPEPLTNGGHVVGSGQMLVVRATGVSIDPGGDYVSFGSIEHRNGFPGVAVPDESFPWPLATIGRAQVEFVWNAYEGGGTIELEVAGSVPAWGLITTGTAGGAVRRSRPVDIAAGAPVKLKVTHDAGTAQTADVIMSLEAQDPMASPTVPGWRLRHFANSDFSPADPTHPDTLELTSPDLVDIPLPSDVRWPGSGVFDLGQTDMSSFVLRLTDQAANALLSSSASCIVTAHSGDPTNYDAQHQDITEVNGPGWVLRWESTDAPDDPGADFNDSYTYIWYEGA